jgi:hypothetical protein
MRKLETVQLKHLVMMLCNTRGTSAARILSQARLPCSQLVPLECNCANYEEGGQGHGETSETGDECQ